MSSLNLHGLRILNTRPEHQSHALTHAIEAAHGTVIHYPTLDILPTDLSWRADLIKAELPDQAIFTSPNAVNFAFAPLAEIPYQFPSSCLITAVGQATKRALTNSGYAVDFAPAQAGSEHVLALASLQQVKEQSIFLFKGVEGRDLISKTLTSRGAKISEYCVYQRSLPNRIVEIKWQNRPVDIILFTSEEGMKNLFILVEAAMHPWLKNVPCMIISERLRLTAETLGMKHIIPCRIETLLNALHQYRSTYEFRR